MRVAYNSDFATAVKLFDEKIIELQIRTCSGLIKKFLLEAMESLSGSDTQRVILGTLEKSPLLDNMIQRLKRLSTKQTGNKL